MDRLDQPLMRLIRNLDRDLKKMDAEIVRFCEKAKRHRDKEMFDYGLSAMANFCGIAAARPLKRAEQALAERERIAKPGAIEPQLAWAQHYATTLSDPLRALERLRRLRRPVGRKGAGQWYEVLRLRGLMELRAGRKRTACRTMRELADFTERHWRNKWIFFFDLYFVREMIAAKLALRDCRRYLQAISQRDQVPHDAKETQRLLAMLDAPEDP